MPKYLNNIKLLLIEKLQKNWYTNFEIEKCAQNSTDYFLNNKSKKSNKLRVSFFTKHKIDVSFYFKRWILKIAFLLHKFCGITHFRLLAYKNTTWTHFNSSIFYHFHPKLSSVFYYKFIRIMNFFINSHELVLTKNYFILLFPATSFLLIIMTRM